MKSAVVKILIFVLCWMVADVPAQTDRDPGPGPALEYYKTALAMHTAGKYPEAIGGFKKSLGSQRTVWTLIALGRSLAESGLLTEAMNAADEALDLAPNDPEAYVLLGVIYDKEGLHEKAVEAYQTGLRLKPDLLLLYSRLGASLVRAGRAREGVKPLERAAGLDPRDAIVQNDLGCAYALIGQYREAIQRFRPRSDSIQVLASRDSIWQTPCSKRATASQRSNNTRS